MSAPAPEECFLLVSVARGILGGGRATRPPVGEWDPKLSGGGETRIFFLFFFSDYALLTLTPSTSLQAVLGALQVARSQLDFER